MATEAAMLSERLAQLDVDGSGSISCNALTKLLTRLGVSEAESEAVVRKFAGKIRQNVNYCDFIEWLHADSRKAGPSIDGENQRSPASRQFKVASVAVGATVKWRRGVSPISGSTEAYIDGSLQDDPELPAAPGGRTISKCSSVREAVQVTTVTFGTHKFKGAEAAPWLKKYRLGVKELDDPAWTLKHADAVAGAIAEWAMTRGATMVCHWTQPLRSATGTWRGSAGTRMVHALFNPGPGGEPVCILDGSYLLSGEGDSRKMIDVTSPMWVQNDTLFIPSVFVNYNNSTFSGMDPVLCEKTPLLRAMHVLSLAGVRLLKLLGHTCSVVMPKIGLEQEFFLVPRSAYDRRPDLQRCGRTLVGALPNGTDLYDTHSEPLNEVAQACMAAIQSECFKLGIHLRTRHRESAPNQYEFAPHFGTASAQIDENLVAMNVIEEVARKHGLVALLHEKPFAGCNGSGKHNNFSLGTDTGLNLFNEKHANMIRSEKLGDYEAFPVIMAAICSAVYRHGNLMMSSVACPGNDFRLTRGGGCEAPPTCVSIHLGESLTNYLTEFANSTTPLASDWQVPKTKVSLGIPAIDQHGIDVSAEPRNRTAPFPYGGRRFELRSSGSSQNVSMVNVVLCTAIAEAFNMFSDEIEKGIRPREVASRALKEGGGLKAVFNENNYSEEWRAEAESRGLACVDSVVDGICQLMEDTTIELFGGLGVLSKQELSERADVQLENYCITVEIEARCLLDMVGGLIVPACRATGLEEIQCVLKELTQALSDMSSELDALHDIEEFDEMAKKACELRLQSMASVRTLCDQLELLVPSSQWPIARYNDLLFDDMKHCR